MRLIVLLFYLSSPFVHQPKTGLKKIEINGFAQGTTYHIIYYATDSVVTKSQTDSILNSIDSSLSIYKTYSVINRFNQSENGIEIDKHLQNVFLKSEEAFNETKGIFDITVAPLVSAWGFGLNNITSVPVSATIQSLKKCVGFKFLHLQETFLKKDQPCVQIDVNGIAQGYSVDVIAEYIEKHFISNYLVELGGEIRVKGNRADGSKMKIGNESPNDNETLQVIQQIIELGNGAITTSGNYRKYYESNGKKITHIIDPQTGYPLQNEMISVSVFAKDAITADAFDNALMVMGRNSALHFVENRKDISAYIIYKKPDGSLADTASKKFYNLLLK